MKTDIARTATSVTVSELLMVMFVLPLLLHVWREIKHTCVSFFVIARCKMFCIDVTVADNNVIFSYDDYRISICCDDLISQK